jgi:phosphatidylserine/phosphatidylglycerophosphate/cardiolipin synthase-like enzyme
VDSRHEVPRVVTQELPTVKTAMEELAALPDGAAARAALAPPLEAYEAWISQRRQLGRQLLAERQGAVDARWTLLTSANFTDRGQTRNIEAGGLLDDPRFALDLLRQWRSAVSAGHFLRAFAKE